MSVHYIPPLVEAVPSRQKMRNVPLAHRLWARVIVRDSTECWEWTGRRNQKGYGEIWASPKRALTHRVAWEIANGPIPDGVFVCHTCDNPPCCNPAHLWLGTIGDNSRDMAAKGRHWQGRKTHCVHGHEFTDENTAIGSDGYRRCRLCQNESFRRYRRARRAA